MFVTLPLRVVWCDQTEGDVTNAGVGHRGSPGQLTALDGKVFFNSRNPVRIAQRIVSERRFNSQALAEALQKITSDELWRFLDSPHGRPFACWSEFATASTPSGLGIATQDDMDELGRVLHRAKLYACWGELLEATTRRRGAPKKNLAVRENTVQIFKIPRARTARARQVIMLSRHHTEIFGQLCSGALDLPDAVRQANLVRRTPKKPLRFGVLDLCGARALSANAQGKLLCELYRNLGVNAQCKLLANEIEPILEFGLAQRWREQVNVSPPP